MVLKVYNTLGRRKEVLKPLKKGRIGMYVCGPTVYGPSHLGHAMTFSVYDSIRKYLQWRGYKVKYVMNITDIHDDIIKQAKKLKTSVKRLAGKFTKAFLKDLESLNISQATAHPKVTENIPEIIALIKRLQKRGLAYETKDGVYYEVSKFRDYGRLSGIKLEKEVKGTRVAADKYEKAKAQDFALWKKQKPGEPAWNSPWGKGRPGWHIECSAMSMKYLGEQFDVHGGAIELAFPHHENEIAQSEGATGKAPFVRYWVHSGILNINGQKMSKSLGNFVTLSEALKKYDGNALRYFFSQSHFQSAINYNENALNRAKEEVGRLQDFVFRLREAISKANSKRKDISLEREIDALRRKFAKAMDDNFNSPLAWAEVFSFISSVNRSSKESKPTLRRALQVFLEITSIFGLKFELRKQKLPAGAQKLIKKREKLRAQKRFKEADKIRAQLRERGIILEDVDGATRWRIVKPKK